jgi:hypothetical protein
LRLGFTKPSPNLKKGNFEEEENKKIIQLASETGRLTCFHLSIFEFEF